jgi:hypothetical protein
MQRLLHVEDNFDQIIISNKISKVVVGGMLKSTTNIPFPLSFQMTLLQLTDQSTMLSHSQFSFMS